MERFKVIDGFEDYEVSDQGYIRRGPFIMAPSRTRDGTLKVNLSQNGCTVTRSVKTLVAEAFVPNNQPIVPPEIDIYGDVIHVPVTKPWDTPIQLDGNSNNCHWQNLAWRPRWFAWKYKRQFSDPIPVIYDISVINLTTGVTYGSVMEAGKADGVLWQGIYNSILTRDFVFPTGHRYDARG